jgi:hypothetical protein
MQSGMLWFIQRLSLTTLLWGAHMHLYSEMLSMSLLVTEYRASEMDEKRREVACRPDEACFLAFRYR